MNEPPETVTASELARTLGVSTRRVRQLAEEGHAVRAGGGRYRFVESVRAYMRFAAEIGERRGSETSLDALREERIDLLRAVRESRDAQLVTMSEAVSVVDEVSAMFLESIEGLPSKIGGGPRERRRVESIASETHERLRSQFADVRASLTGQSSA